MGCAAVRCFQPPSRGFAKNGGFREGVSGRFTLQGGGGGGLFFDERCFPWLSEGHHVFASDGSNRPHPYIMGHATSHRNCDALPYLFRKMGSASAKTFNAPAPKNRISKNGGVTNTGMGSSF